MLVGYLINLLKHQKRAEDPLVEQWMFTWKLQCTFENKNMSFFVEAFRLKVHIRTCSHVSRLRILGIIWRKPHQSTTLCSLSQISSIYTPVMESRGLVSVWRRVSRPVYSSLGLECLRSRIGLELFVSRLCMSYFFMKSCIKQLLKKGICIVFFENSAVQNGKWLSFLCCYATMEKTVCPLPCLKFVLNSIKTVCVPVKPQRIISAMLATRR